MSRMASRVRSVSSSGSTCRNVCPLAVKVDTPSLVSLRYVVESGPSGNGSWYAKSVIPRS